MSKIKKGVITEPLPWRKFFDNKYLSAHDLVGDLTVTIKEMRFEEVVGEKGQKDDCLIAVFTDAELLPMIVNITNSKIIAELYGSKLPIDWVGKSITLYAKSGIRNQRGESVEGIRIRPVKPQIKKKSLSKDGFDRMIKAIQAGKFDKSNAKAYALTAEQKKALEAIKQPTAA